MSVLDRAALEDSPLADLHALASELGIDGFRRLRKAQLIDAILEQQGGDGAAAAAEPEPEPEEKPKRSRRGGRSRSRKDADDAESSAPAAPAAEKKPAREDRVV